MARVRTNRTMVPWFLERRRGKQYSPNLDKPLEFGEYYKRVVLGRQLKPVPDTRKVHTLAGRDYIYWGRLTGFSV